MWINDIILVLLCILPGLMPINGITSMLLMFDVIISVVIMLIHEIFSVLQLINERFPNLVLDYGIISILMIIYHIENQGYSKNQGEESAEEHLEEEPAVAMAMEPCCRSCRIEEEDPVFFSVSRLPGELGKHGAACVSFCEEEGETLKALVC